MVLIVSAWKSLVSAALKDPCIKYLPDGTRSPTHAPLYLTGWQLARCGQCHSYAFTSPGCNVRLQWG